MMSIFSLLCVLLLFHSVQADVSDQYKGLRFSNDGYIQFSPDMSPFVNKMSVCSWVRDLGSNQYHTIFGYGQDRVRFESSAYYNCMANQCNLDVRSQLQAAVSKGNWFHACLTWSTASRSLRYYANGRLLGTMQTDSRTLTTGYKVVLGNNPRYMASSHAFAGEMLGLNVYSKELSAEEVKRLSNAGMCSTEDDENEGVRIFRWEDLLKKSRTGTVTDFIEVEQCGAKIFTRLSETEQELNERENQLNTTQQELIEVSRNLTRTTEELNTAKYHLEHCNKTSGNWDWDLFVLETYVNKTISSEVSEQLRSSWDKLAEMMIGFTITDQFITFLKHVDTDKCTEERPWTMLYTERYLNKVFTREMAESLSTMWDEISEKLVGVTMTEKTVELLKYVSCKGNCADHS